MRVVGVIAEYNPFHLGHAHHLAEARRLAQADAVVVVMSSVFTQRGDAAILSPADRTRMALAAGADAVFALPAQWAVRDAEHFALGGVSILAGLGCNAISFGTEDASLSNLEAAAWVLDAPDESFSTAIRSCMDTGLSYPSAVAAVMKAMRPDCADLLLTPNSTLALCYLRALRLLDAPMEVFPVQRVGAYHDSALGDALPSATALRGAILRGDWAKVRAAMPAEAYHILREAAAAGRIHRPDALDTALLYRLRTMNAEEYATLPNLTEGIHNRLYNALDAARTREDLLQTAKTRRYPYARLSRLATHALLGFTEDDLQAHPLPEAAMLLGFRKDKRELFTHIASHGKLPIISRASDLRHHSHSFVLEDQAYDIWALGAGMATGLMRTQGIVTL